MSAIANARFCVFALSALGASVLPADDWRDLMWEKYVQLRPGVRARAYALESPRRMKAYVVRIDLSAPGVGFAATERAADWGSEISGAAGKGLRTETTRETTQDFMSRRRREGLNVEVAVNTTPWSPFPAPEGCEACDPFGWCVADGVEVSFPKKREALFVVRKDGTAGITSEVPRGGTNGIAFAASGFDLLMTNGIDTVSFNRKENASLHPRTAFGLVPDGKTLVLLAVDGRQPGYSDGATLDDVRAILRREGVSDAVNMDGGGSTSLVVWDRKNGRPEMLNRHPRNTVRKNAVNFGITFADADPADLSGRLGALYHSYEFEPVEDTPPPEGFKPFYISHYGRHGSRRATGKCVSDVLETIEAAEKARGLTDEGRRLYGAVRIMAEEHEGMDGELSERGAQEHRRLARRMAARFPDVIKGRRRVRCRAATGTHNIAQKIFDITRAMRTNAKNAVALSLAIAGAVASPMRSDAVSRKGSTPPHCRVASYAQPKGLSNTFYMTAQPCAASVAISKVAALVEEYKLVASQFKGKKKTDPEPEPEPTPEAQASAS